MTGLNLETFLHLLRADLGAWVTLGLIGLVLALMAWTSWGSRRALRKCLVLSIMAHVGLALYGGTVPMVLLAMNPEESDPASRERIRKSRFCRPRRSSRKPPRGGRTMASATPRAWLLGPPRRAAVRIADRPLSTAESATLPEVAIRPGERDELAIDAAEPTAMNAAPPAVEERLQPLDATPEPTAPPAVAVARGAEDDVAPAVVARDEPRRRWPRRPPLGCDRAPGAVPLAVAPTRLPALPAAAPRPKEEQVALTPRNETEPPSTTAVETPAPLRNPPRTTPCRSTSSPRGRNRRASKPARLICERERARLRPRGMPARPKLATNLPANPTPGPAPVSPPLDALCPRRPSARRRNRDPPPPGRPSLRPKPTSLRPRSSRRPVETRRCRSLPKATSAAARGLRVLGTVGVANSQRDRRFDPPARDAQRRPRALRDSRSRRRPSARRRSRSLRSRLDPNRSALAFRSGQAPRASRPSSAPSTGSPGIRTPTADGTARPPATTTAPPSRATTTTPCIARPAKPASANASTGKPTPPLTGLALLAYLGAGYTQTDGKYAETVGKGLDFLLLATETRRRPARARARPSACIAMRWPPSPCARLTR